MEEGEHLDLHLLTPLLPLLPDPSCQGWYEEWQQSSLVILNTVHFVAFSFIVSFTHFFFGLIRVHIFEQGYQKVASKLTAPFIPAGFKIKSGSV